MQDLRFEQAAASAIPVLALAVVVGQARFEQRAPHPALRWLVLVELIAFVSTNVSAEATALASLYYDRRYSWAGIVVGSALIVSTAQLANLAVQAVFREDKRAWPVTVGMSVIGVATVGGVLWVSTS